MSNGYQCQWMGYCQGLNDDSTRHSCWTCTCWSCDMLSTLSCASSSLSRTRVSELVEIVPSAVRPCSRINVRIPVNRARGIECCWFSRTSLSLLFCLRLARWIQEFAGIHLFSREFCVPLLTKMERKAVIEAMRTATQPSMVCQYISHTRSIPAALLIRLTRTMAMMAITRERQRNEPKASFCVVLILDRRRMMMGMLTTSTFQQSYQDSRRWKDLLRTSVNTSRAVTSPDMDT